MTSQPDKIFRDKLSGYQKSAPPAAWERIEKGLEGSGSKGVWLKVAAAIMVLAIPLFILWPDAQQETISDISISKDEISQPVAVEEKAQEVFPSGTKEKAESFESSPKVLFNQSNTDRKSENIRAVSVVTQNEIENDNSQTSIIAIPEPMDEKDHNVAKSIASTQNKSSTIVYTAEEVNARFLRKDKVTSKTGKEAEISKTIPVEEKASPFRISDVAASIKNSEPGFGDLRQIKDDILSFDFLVNNDKNNKK